MYDALANCKDGDTVTLIADFKVTGNTSEDRLVITHKITFDFGNYFIKGAGALSRDESYNFTILFVDADTTFVAKNGGIFSEDDTENNECGPYAVNVRNAATLTIESGAYHGGGTAVQVQEGKLVINGGKFSVTPYADERYGYKYQINAIDAAFKDGSAQIVIRGGSFYKFDPANSKSENPRGEFTDENYTVNCVDEWYTVVPRK